MSRDDVICFSRCLAKTKVVRCDEYQNIFLVKLFA